MLRIPTITSRGGMGQAERDRYNLKRGGTAGMATLIPKGGAPAAVAGAPASAAASTIPTSSGSVPFSAQGFMDAYKSAYDEAKTSNQGRYDEISGLLNQRYDRNMKYLEGAGVQEGADINEAYGAQQGSMMQNLAGSGLAGTTIAPTMAAGIERQRIADQGRLKERINNQKVSTDAALSGDIASFKERRDDPYPDMGTYAQLAMQLGASGMAGAGAPGAVGGVPGFGAPPPPVGPSAANNWAGGMVSYKEPAGWGYGEAKPGTYDKQRPLTDAEKSVLKMGGTVSGYSGSRGLAPAPQSVSIGAPSYAAMSKRLRSPSPTSVRGSRFQLNKQRFARV
ncbi:MAG: hypothetical protein WC100_03325 [Sterolibacterium sp.]